MGLVLAAAAAVAAAISHTAHAERQPQTLWILAHSRIAAFAQDGRTIGWVASGIAPKCNVVHLQSLAYGVGYDLPSQDARNVTCRFIWGKRQPVQLALAGGDALWSLPQDAPIAVDYLLGAGVGASARAERRFLEIAHTRNGVGQWLGGVAGDGDTLAYTVTSVDFADEAGCLAGDKAKCTLVKAGGGVYVVRGRQPAFVPATGPAVDIATSAGAIAYVPTGGLERSGRPRPSADLPISVVSTSTGAQISSVVPQGVPLAIALTPSVLATLERTPLGTRLAWYDRTSGRIRGSLPVPNATAPALTANDQLIVFHVGRSLRAAYVASHRTRLLARAAATPVGLSLEGSRLAWAENLPGRSRVQVLYVSGRG
jgi:hypothetical protein